MNHQISTRTRGALFAALLGFALMIVSCNSEPIQSEWHDKAMDLNGKPDLSEFKGLRIKDVQARFVIANDADEILLAVQTGNEAVRRQIEMGGVTLWLTNPKNKKESVGVRYPARLGPKDQRREFAPEEFSPDRTKVKFDRPSANVEVLAKKSASRMLSEADAKDAGIFAESKYETATSAYTLAINFAAAAPWLAAGDEVELRVEVPKMKMKRPDGEFGEGQRRGPPMGGDDFGGGGGGMRGGKRGGSPSGIANRSAGKAIKIVQRVVLAAGG
ncbi:MAG: hypothetical protein KDB65_09340 [Calditrichaeota bacterium]|nr:hypothetical protein [Calditrichota bacterium]MCB9369090.1 hypothetical protein [Calditrichota bacterium]